MKDLIFESWRRFLNEQEIKPLYTAAVLDSATVGELRNRLKEILEGLGVSQTLSGWKESSTGSHGHEQLNHHMTFVAAPAAKSKVPPEMLNQQIQLNIVGFGIDEALGIAAWQVETSLKSAVQSGNPHITAMLKDESVKPFLAGKITTWKPLSKPFALTATIQEVFPKAKE